jgi:hypothetical protein
VVSTLGILGAVLFENLPIGADLNRPKVTSKVHRTGIYTEVVKVP